MLEKPYKLELQKQSVSYPLHTFIFYPYNLKKFIVSVTRGMGLFVDVTEE